MKYTPAARIFLQRRVLALALLGAVLLLLSMAPVRAAPEADGLNYPDLSVIILPGRMSVVGAGAGRMFQYTHDTFNGGPGPLVIQPAYNASSGTYLGTQYVYALRSGTWTLERRVRVAGGFVFHEEHGHFHFPFARFGLYAVGSDGRPGRPVALSGKNGFCINDSFIYDPSLPNAGDLGNLGSCLDPTSLRGLNIGAVDEYDRSDPGQSISLAGVADGTYWLRAVVDPDDLLAESDESNNETDVLVRISGNTVTELRTVVPKLPPPPSVTLTAPADLSRVSGSVTLRASTAVGTAVQFLLDGRPLGRRVAAPFTLAWNTAGVPDGTHWLAVQTTDPRTGRTGTSRVARVRVANGGTVAPAVTLTSPNAGATLSAITALGAAVASSARITGVQFLVDGLPVGPRLTAPPYLLYWDSRKAADGAHEITAQATDAYGLTGTSPAVRVTVDNAHPPAVLRLDARALRDGSDTLTTPPFSTTDKSALLVAFVAYDGPRDTRQTARVSGAGLGWRLVMRANTQLGTSEIWAARPGYVLRDVNVSARPAVAGFHGSLVVLAFSNAAGTGITGRAGAPRGAPDIYLPGVSAGNWVFAVGNDWDRAVPRVPVAGQVLVHQRVDTAVGDTFWVQATAAPSTANALVEIRDVSPTSDQWNYAAVEVVAVRP
jgi:hypothetical protein